VFAAGGLPAHHGTAVPAGGTAPASPPAASPSAPARSPGDKAAGNVAVQGAPPEAQREIDRKSYSLASDAQAAAGSLADVLRNLPGGGRQPAGQISIRGDSNVTILVDGQPSPLFQGPGRAQLLQQLSADMYERAEVMTNPSAAFRPEGGGGISNLITKKRSKPGFGFDGGSGWTANTKLVDRRIGQTQVRCLCLIRRK
jgi:hypothetical protein